MKIERRNNEEEKEGEEGFLILFVFLSLKIELYVAEGKD